MSRDKTKILQKSHSKKRKPETFLNLALSGFLFYDILKYLI